MIDYKQLGQAVAAARMEKLIKKQELCDLADLSINTLERIEQGRGNFRIDSLDAVCQTLGISMAEIIGQAETIDEIEGS